MTTDQVECAFCRATSPRKLAICKSINMDGNMLTGVLCRDCIRTFILEMAWTDPEEFEKLIVEAKNPPVQPDF